MSASVRGWRDGWAGGMEMERWTRPAHRGFDPSVIAAPWKTHCLVSLLTAHIPTTGSSINHCKKTFRV